MTVLVDVTQFTRQPARSGVQRALAELARWWPSDVPALFMHRSRHGQQGVEPGDFADAVDSLFATSPRPDDAARLAQRLTGRTVTSRDFVTSRLLLPEPTYDGQLLGDMEQRVRRGKPVGTLVFDCLPMTVPWAFPGNGQAATSRYFRLLGRSPLAIATSDSVQQVLVQRLRRPPATTPVAWLGFDSGVRPRTRAARAARFVIVGTVEPRKRVPLALDAIELLHASAPHARLVVLGRAGCEEPAALARLARAAKSGQLVEWASDASDWQLARELSRATALLAVGEEGFGLPVAEALTAGCPVLFAGVQPAASLAEGHGAWRVDASSASALADALLTWCDADYAARRAAEVDVSGLPTWAGFARQVADQVTGLA
jgi:glycosyltransferase involved in cell wall biosynthesis